MKQTKKKILCLIFAVLMILSFAACGKGKTSADSNIIDLGDCELLYKSACIMDDSDGNDAIVLTLDFTNKGKENASYLWSVDETIMQNGAELEVATVFTGSDYSTIIENQFKDVEPGATLEVKTAYVLSDTTSEITATFEEIFGGKKGTITIDPTTLGQEGTGDELLDWWNGDWYGWWQMTGCSGTYESMEGKWWDVCGTIDIGADYTGTVTLWDEDYTKSEPMASVNVSLNEAGTGDHGTIMSEGGWFTDVELEHADWIVDPGLMERDNIICIEGWYENGDDEYYYEIYLRPWGTYWNDAGEDFLPYNYESWYLPLIDDGKSMPDSIGSEAPSSSMGGGGNTS